MAVPADFYRRELTSPYGSAYLGSRFRAVYSSSTIAIQIWEQPWSFSTNQYVGRRFWLRRRLVGSPISASAQRRLGERYGLSSRLEATTDTTG